MEIIHNQTDYQQLEAELQAARKEITRLRGQFANIKQYYVDLFESAGDSIFIIDPQSNQILVCNNNAARRLGYLTPELIGRPIDEIEVAGDLAEQQDVFWESTVSGTTVYECHYRHRDGHLIPVEVSSRLVRTGGREIIQSFVRNISVRKQMEKEREELIADLDSFAGMVAHDLKNPISIALGYAYLLQERWEVMSPQDVGDGLNLFTRNCERLINIVDELLLFATVRKENAIERTPLQMADIMVDVEARLANLIEKQNAIIIMPDEWPVALSYAPWVKEVWFNYLSNGLKYGGTPPRLELGSQREPQQMIRFWVKDNGPGIPPDKQAELFAKFERLGQTRLEGHGLGLAIVKRIVAKLGGEVGVESSPGQGSTFSFTLPADIS